VIHLDTSFLVDLIREQRRERSGPATAWLAGQGEEVFGVSVFVVCELETGVSRGLQAQRERVHLRDLLGAIETVFPDDRFAPVYGALLSRIWSNRRSIDTLDLLIATTARVDDVPLLTANVRHFAMVPDLEVMTYR
jgi:predicted nucleic acid-binding protein